LAALGRGGDDPLGVTAAQIPELFFLSINIFGLRLVLD
jgi:hypothetical protein